MSQAIHQQSAQGYRPLLNIYDLIDRVLDKGLVIDANVSVALVGIEILVVRARIVVAGIDTFLRYATALGLAAPIATQNPALSEAG
jgi:gas vesicle structural protein